MMDTQDIDRLTDEEVEQQANESAPFLFLMAHALMAHVIEKNNGYVNDEGNTRVQEVALAMAEDLMSCTLLRQVVPDNLEDTTAQIFDELCPAVIRVLGGLQTHTLNKKDFH